MARCVGEASRLARFPLRKQSGTLRLHRSSSIQRFGSITFIVATLVRNQIGPCHAKIEEFVRLLRAHAGTRVVDVRTVPRSRHNPQFNRDTLPDSLKSAGIGYIHMPELGGLRRAARDSAGPAPRPF
jgi:hypothetical protein